MRTINRAAGMFIGMAALATVACSDVIGPAHSDPLAGRWEGVNTAGVEYVYVFEATGESSRNPRTENVAPAYSLSYSTSSGSTGTITAWHEGSKVYWGSSSLGTIDKTMMTVQSEDVAPFMMHRQ
jgi:hypothetical protein